MPATSPPEEPAGVAGGECPRCGTLFEPGQEYCLECGARLPDTHGIAAAIGSSWRRRLPWYPGDWIWPVLVGLVIAGLATGVAIAVRDAGGTDTTLVATQPAQAGGTVGPAPEPEPLPTTAPTTEPEQPPPPPRNRIIEWPPGTNGYTIVLESIPTSAGRALATTKARAALRAGLQEVGVLNSSRYASLHPGYFVVFSGIFDSLAEAQGALTAAQTSGYPAAYARPITS